MNVSIFLLALIQLFTALLLGVLVNFITFRVFKKLISRRHSIQLDNVSFAIMAACVIFSVGYITSSAISPLFQVVRSLQSSNTLDTNVFWLSIKYGVLFISLGFVISFLVVMTGIFMFNTLTTNIKEFEEISRDNRAIGILAGVIIIVIALFVKDTVVFIMETLMPYPSSPIRH